MENNLEPKSLADLIHNPSEISAIISDPAESGMRFYQSLHNKDKSYVAFAAGVGLLAYGLYLSKSGSASSKKDNAGSTGNQGTSSKGNNLAASFHRAGAQSSASTGEGNNKNISTKELDVKKKNK
ncbi:hypothetical protein [Rufibacter sp. DG15C]|uniref:hypothetical protein n=1 Tax=Rufibacter sp. DG15C TaxID=1379909 RepID=UPI000833DD7C|nr:hypothetical protein [Rufibacter sp. DG15C]